MRRLTLPLTAIVVLITGSTVFAHPQSYLHSHATGFEAGVMHPLTGLDHLLAMLAVGIVAARSGRRTTWLLPLVFLTCMVVGAISAFAVPGVELGIALSVVALGVAMAARSKVPSVCLFLACSLFGFLHGQAHGAEMPSLAQPWFYLLGLVLASVALNAAGILVGRISLRSSAAQLPLRMAGTAMAAAGFVMVFGAL